MKQLQSFKYFKVLFFVFSLAFLQACSSRADVCDDIFSKYAKKPEKLQFIKCVKGEGQTVYIAKYVASSEHSNEIEKFLAEKYTLMKLKDYYHSMPMNQVYIESKDLLKINPYYSLLIDIEHPNVDLHDAGIPKKNSSFIVNVSIMLI